MYIYSFSARVAPTTTTLAAAPHSTEFEKQLRARARMKESPGDYGLRADFFSHAARIAIVPVCVYIRIARVREREREDAKNCLH